MFYWLEIKKRVYKAKLGINDTFKSLYPSRDLKTTAAGIFKILLKWDLHSLKRPLILMYFQKYLILEL